MSSYATVLGGRVTDYQPVRPAVGQPVIEVKAGALIAEAILFWGDY